jgi:DNA-binding XRE family transcriptional regulator
MLADESSVQSLGHWGNAANPRASDCKKQITGFNTSSVSLSTVGGLDEDGIRTLRNRNGWTQTDMAVHLGLSRGHISDLERGKREVGLITLQVIARGLGTTMARLLTGL